jgi:hypothetical protein
VFGAPYFDGYVAEKVVFVVAPKGRWEYIKLLRGQTTPVF